MMNKPLYKAILLAGNQQKLAELAGVSQATISLALSRKTHFRHTTARKIAQAVEQRVTEFELMLGCFDQ